MRIGIKKFGAIKDASMDINRLTILCGTNNSGKSYFTRTVYGVMDVLRTGDFRFPIPDEKFREFFVHGKVSFPDLRSLVEEYSGAVNDFLKQSDYFNDKGMAGFCLLPCVLDSEVSVSFDQERFYRELYEEAIDIKLPVTDEQLQLVEKIEKWKADEWRLTIRVRKSACSGELELSLWPSPGKTLSDYQQKNESLASDWYKALPQTLATVFNDRLCPLVVLLSSLRASCSLFGLEHSYLTERLERLSVDDMTETEAKTIARTVCMSVPYGISGILKMYREPQTYFNDENVSEIYKKSEILRRTLSDLVGGEYLVVDNRIVFLPSGSKYPLPIAECSSSVQSLMDVFLFVKYQLRENIAEHVNPMLMIDEPEQNLHPAKQRMFARLVAILVNAGVPVFVTTHSDYFIREINALTLMKGLPQEKLDIVRREFMYEDEMFLDADNVSISVAEAGSIRQMTYVPRCGFPVKSFDDTVEQYNALFSVIID